ncbi:MAG: cytochrome c oxidase accessory protein CcoG [Rhodospirillaceae bacterium]
MNKFMPEQNDDDAEEAALFAEHKKVYPKSVRGLFRTIKWSVLTILLSIYYIMPFVRWNRGPGMENQAVLFDLSGRRFYFFDVEIWPQQIYYVTIILILSAIALFLVTSLFGRVWCGYACPQTVWTDLYMLVERWIEGERGERVRRDQGPMTASKFRLKLIKHVIWLTIALMTGGWFIMYFYDAPTLIKDILAADVSSSVVVLIGVLTTTTYFLAGFVREHVCTYMCPWPRFQAAMLDEESLVVTYRRWRGENRAPLRKAQAWTERSAAGFGDCIECGACQHVCPTGIDIRNGVQLQCIGCALCIDACDEVMTRIGRPRGLIAFDTDNNQMARAAGQPARFRLLRGRTVSYALIMAIVSFGLVFSYEERSVVQVNVQKDRAPVFVRLHDGEIMNGYTLKVLNMTREARGYELSVAGIVGAAMVLAGGNAPPTASLSVNAAPDSVATFRVMVRAPLASLTGASTPMHFVLTPRKGTDGDRYDTVFMGPQ